MPRASKVDGQASGSSGDPAAKAGPSKAAKATKAAAKTAAKRSKSATDSSSKETAAKDMVTKSARKSGKSEITDKWLLEQRALLLKERETYTRQAESLKAEADALAEEMEPGDVQFDEESGEGGTLNVERERDLALSAQARAAVEEIDRALAKIEVGTYGVCERCGQPIPRVRLKAIPQAALCVDCKSGGLLRR
jgi:DnaK suppressor protein